ncbi:hypothetical protein KTO58_24285 [Chitinophaga pendula]|uniref:hypothetical protein n=1 Tax=Chitinophaga TaxID=79328 RepID=UPI000BAFF798|nr:MULTISPECIES: hypothetical protein [Chitinophaga]ASZ10287.1 hypothetical protein CK934_04475 [Chitinophaga sp. MD30]UCJ06751.1 hypothetical protein KTO58_24285 [Chitinophaga pendula]
MKKSMLTTAIALLLTGSTFSFAQDKGKKADCNKKNGKNCCKKEQVAKGKSCCQQPSRIAALKASKPVKSR